MIQMKGAHGFLGTFAPWLVSAEADERLDQIERRLSEVEEKTMG